MTNKTLSIKKAKQHYTMVEILVVIGIMAILMGMGTAGINAVTSKRGVNGGVSIVSSQINLARSVAVVKNSYIALLLPAPKATENPQSSSSMFKDKFFKSMRLCYVKRATDAGTLRNDTNYSYDFVFSGWVEDHYWVDLPTKVCANFIEGTDNADRSIPQGKYEVKNILQVPRDSGDDSCLGIIFSPGGSLISSENALVQIYPGITKPNGSLEMLGLGTEWGQQNKGNLKYRRWCVRINLFTGRSKTSYAQVEK